MANPENVLKHKLQKGSERTREIGRLGGAAGKNNPNVQRAAKLRWLKRRIATGQLKTADETWLLERLENKELIDIDMLSWLDKLRAECTDESQEAKLLDLYSKIAKQIHPLTNKLDINVRTLNLNEPIPKQMLELLTADFEDDDDDEE